MTVLVPGYGETPLEADEADALTESARELLGDEPLRADVYDAEQAISVIDVSIALLTDVIEGRRAIPHLLCDTFVRKLHHDLYADVWTHSW